MPKVSIIIPCYNVENYIKECLDSVVNQTLKDIEIICVDDGSTDSTGRILDDYAIKDSRIKVIHKPNSGYGASMNVGIDNATGDYIGIVEPDDYVELNMFEKLHNIAIETQVDFVKSDFFNFCEDMVQNYIQLDNKNTHYNRVINPMKEKSIFHIGINTWTGIYKTDFINSNNIRYNETPGARYQDQGFWFQTMMFAKSVYILNQAFYHYRYFQTNSSNNPNGFYWIQTEYSYIFNLLNQHSDLKKELIQEYNCFKFNNYLFNFGKLDKKAKKKHLKMIRSEFIQALKNKEIEISLFNEYELKMFNLLIKNPRKFYRKMTNSQSLLQKIFSVKNIVNDNVKRKEITLLGVKFKFGKQVLYENIIEEKINDLNDKFNNLYNEIHKGNNSQEMLTQILLEDNLGIDSSSDFNDLLKKAKMVGVSYWDNDSKGLDFFRNFSYLFNKDTNINIINDYNKRDVFADIYFSWGTRSYLGQMLNIYNSKLYKKPLVVAEDGFLRSIVTNACAAELTKYHRGIAFTFDSKAPYYDARRASNLEDMFNNKNLIITDDQKLRARCCIDKIVGTHLSKYNNQPIFEPKIGREGVKKVLVVDQSYGDMSIAKGLADDYTFKNMLECAIKENPDADIIVKTHPDTIAGAGGYYTGLQAHDNIYTQTEPINPISLIKYVDKVYVCTTQFGFEALMCGKEVHVLGMPFYAGWGLTNDRQKCERRTNTRTLEEIFYITYIMYSHYVNPDKGSRCEIEEAMDYLLKLRDEYFQESE